MPRLPQKIPGRKFTPSISEIPAAALVWSQGGEPTPAHLHPALAAIFAPLNREAALKFALRSAGGVALFFVAADGLHSGRRAAWIMLAVSIGAVIAGCAGLLEIESNAAQTALLIFKTQPTLVGDLVRASGTFQYANTAAMYWEAALPIIVLFFFTQKTFIEGISMTGIKG